MSKTKGMLATLLDLKPIITLDGAGKAKSISMSRGVSSGKRKIVSMLRKRLATGNGPQPDVEFAIAHVDNRKDAQWLADELKKTFRVDREIFIKDAAPVLATHTGFGTVGLAYIEPEQDTRARE